MRFPVAISLLVALAFLAFAYRRLRTYLHFYQQEEYDSKRFVHWLVARRSFDTRASILLLVLGVLELASLLSSSTTGIIAAFGFVGLSFFEKDPRFASKKKLVMTDRAKRIYFSAFGLLLIGSLAIAIAGAPLLVWIIPVQLIPIALVAGNLLTKPYEDKIQKRFWSEAHRKLQALNPTIVGITGSYGKTSTKHLLGHILEMQAPTLITPGSVNTPMGIARVVREQLASHHRFFVCEMGAYGPGSIERLCRLAPPDLGVITAIGMAHYERFKTLEVIARTKFELAEAVAAKGGTVIVAEQVLDLEPARNFCDRHSQNTIIVGKSPACALRLVSSAQTQAGIQAEVIWNGSSYALRAPIYGEHHISNMAVAFAAACILGVLPEDAIVALASVPQISHRLELKSGPKGARIIDDAYNSNPVGFASALQLLNTLNTNGGRRILVTPGIVELGQAHDEEHRKIGELAANQVDVLLAVVPDRIKSLTLTYASLNPNGAVLPCLNFAAAHSWMNENLRPDDVVLLENDLPDLYEKRLKL
jgi:UDP-N-acetylmuramoyl-tripeptide--D-alanyl-D-alanine ligase